MKLYYIYHVEGVKIGCTKLNPKVRVKQQGYSAFQVLEVHDDIYVASKRELELQIQYGYTKDVIPYYMIVSRPTIEGSIKGGKMSGKQFGKWAVESGHLASIATFESRSKGGKIAGKIAGKKAVESGHLASIRTRENSIKGGKIAMAIEQTCPYCSKTMKGAIYFRFHGQKCKLAPVTT